MNELALFAGAGGGILGGHLLGWRTVCAVEQNAYAAGILVARQNDNILPPFPIWDDVRTFDGRPWRGIVDVVSGGFPCQDISCAGKGAGIDGERSGLWAEMARIIGEVRPRFVFVENSPMLVNRGLGRVLGDLSTLGYDAQWGVVSAADTGAPHKRERIWIVGCANSNGESAISEHDEAPVLLDVGHTNHYGQFAAEKCRCVAQGGDRGSTWQKQASELARPSEQRSQLANPSSTGLQGCEEARDDGKNREKPEHKQLAGCGGVSANRACQKLAYTECVRSHSAQDQQVLGGKRTYELCVEQSRSNGCRGWPLEPAVGRVANGVAARVDRLKALGNGQVPRVAAAAWRILTANA